MQLQLQDKLYGYTFLTLLPSECSNVICNKFVCTRLPDSYELKQVTITCRKRSVTQPTYAYSYIDVPTQTGAKNCTSSTRLRVGRELTKNLVAQSQPNQQPILSMSPPNILPLRFLSYTCISIVFFNIVEESDLQLTWFCFKVWLSLCTITDSSYVGGVIYRFRLLQFFRVTCLCSPSSFMILKNQFSQSNLSLGTSQALPFFLLLATITKLAEQANLSLPSNCCNTSMWTSMELLPTQDTQPESRQSVSIRIGQQNSISSTAAVTTMKSNASISNYLPVSGMQYRKATFEAMQSINQSNRPTLILGLEN